MKKIAAALLLTSAVAAPAFADDNGFYAGVTLGQARMGNIAANTVMTKSTNSVYGGLVGYQFTKNWGVEAQFTGAGKYQATTGAINLSGKADTFAVAATGTLPMSDTFSLYGKLGVGSTKTTVASIPVSNASGATRTAVTVGLGVQYNVTPAVGIRAGWDRYGAAINVGAGKNNFNSDVYSVGVVVKF